MKTKKESSEGDGILSKDKGGVILEMGERVNQTKYEVAIWLRRF